MLIEYDQAHADLLEVLVKMKESVDRYAAKEDSNQEWVAVRKNYLAIIFNYTKIAHRNYSILNQERNNAYNDGFSRGVESVRRKEGFPNNNELRALYGKEGFRRYHNNLQINKWADLH